jgi:hypothetical protein
MCMDLGRRPEAVGDLARSERFDVFRQHLEPAWIEDALKTTGTVSLPAAGCPPSRQSGPSSAWRCYATAPFRRSSAIWVSYSQPKTSPPPSPAAPSSRLATGWAKSPWRPSSLRWLATGSKISVVGGGSVSTASTAPLSAFRTRRKTRRPSAGQAAGAVGQANPRLTPAALGGSDGPPLA